MLLWSGSLVSAVGTQASTIAFPLLVLSLTGSPAQAGFIGGVRWLPYALLSLPAGALVDQWDRKRVMLICNAGRGLAMASIPITFWLGAVSLPLLYAAALVEGLLYVFSDLANVASIPRIVPKDQLQSAVAQNNVAWSASALVGPPLGSFLFGAIGRVAPFVVDAISYGALVLSLLFVKTSLRPEARRERRRLRHDVQEGLVWLWRQPVVRFLSFLSVGVQIMWASSALLIIVLAHHLHAPTSAIGVIFSAGAIVGLLSSFLVPPLRRRASFAQLVIVTAWLMALLFPLYALAPTALALAAVNAVVFAASQVYNMVQMGYRLAQIPDELQGRVNSVFRLIAFTGQPLGMAICGILLQTVGGTWTVLALSAMLAGMALLTSMNRNIRRAEEIAAALREQRAV